MINLSSFLAISRAQDGSTNHCSKLVPSSFSKKLLLMQHNNVHLGLFVDHLHWRCLLVKLSATATLDCTCLGHLGQLDIDRIISIGQGKLIRCDIACDIACDIVLNIANVNSALTLSSG